MDYIALLTPCIVVSVFCGVSGEGSAVFNGQTPDTCIGGDYQKVSNIRFKNFYLQHNKYG